MPKNLEVIALKIEIIVKWKNVASSKFPQAYFIEYRKRFDLEWTIVPADSKTSLVIDGLHMDTIYFVRMFSRSILGESNKTDEFIVKTGAVHFINQSCQLTIHFLEEKTYFYKHMTVFYVFIINLQSLIYT